MIYLDRDAANYKYPLFLIKQIKDLSKFLVACSKTYYCCWVSWDVGV